MGDRIARSAVRKRSRTPRPVAALVADRTGRIFELPGYAAVGAAGARMEVLTPVNTVPMPFGGELMYLPDRMPILYDRACGRTVILADNPLCPGEPVFPVAAFNSPGYVVGLAAAYSEREGAGVLPLFSYAAVGWDGKSFRTPLIRVDAEPRQDLRQMKREDVLSGIRRMRKRLPGNRLLAHLETCALEYGCPAGKNFFLSRYEAPLPAAVACNARCLGCLSLQKTSDISCSQHRIGFTPSPEEIAEVALVHIRKVDRAVVSFGQGCEGDPLLAADVIAPAIRLIRQQTSSGTIHMNTNGSLPEVMSGLIAAGLDSVRVSVNSFREPCYNAYFRPVGYGLENVVETIDRCLRTGRFTAINYLNLPGFTDTPEEFAALGAFLRAHPVHMIQWRNLNYDPARYLAAMSAVSPVGRSMGTGEVLGLLRREFPGLIHGYFNPPKEKWS